MSKKSVREQKVLSGVMGVIVLLVALFSFSINVEGTGWFVFLAVIFDMLVIVAIFIELVNEAHIETQEKLGVCADPKGIKITDEMREKYKRCQTDGGRYDARKGCDDYPTDLPKTIYLALAFEGELNEETQRGTEHATVP